MLDPFLGRELSGVVLLRNAIANTKCLPKGKTQKLKLGLIWPSYLALPINRSTNPRLLTDCLQIAYRLLISSPANQP